MTFWIKKRKIDEQDLEQIDGHECEVQVNSREIKRSLHRWKIIVGLLTAFLGILVFVYGAISYTSTPSFCKVCHEMAPEHVTYEASAHNQINCTECHVEPGAVNTVVHKVESLKEVYYHIVGAPDPIIQTVAVSDENCKNCHTSNRLITATGDLIVNHEDHIDEGIPCITCHSGVAHGKIVERGINGSNTYKYWTAENVDTLITDEYMKPNMGTCIDCHDQVNEGKKPWKDISYSLPDKTDIKEKKKPVVFVPTPEMAAGELEKDIPENTQKIILQAIGQQTDVKISMECFVCHQKINTPKNHDEITWGQNHGNFALRDLNQCLECHTDSKWVKKYEKKDILELLAGKQEEEVILQKGMTLKEISRTNHFCITCHQVTRPDDHLDRYTWLIDTHRQAGDSKEEREGCFVCHDVNRPESIAASTAPSDVYCQFCHEHKFEDD